MVDPTPFPCHATVVTKAPLSSTRLVWAIAFPAMLANVATALFGLADMWVIGRLGDPAAQGAVELGAKYMLGMLNVFNFLRTGTVALTAQAAGRGDTSAQAATLARALAAAGAIGAVMMVAMPFSVPLGLDFLEAHGPLRLAASTYVEIRYWSGPIWLVNCVLVGWLIGRRKVRAVLCVEIAANIVHIALALALVLGLHWGVAGVATATLLSEIFKSVLLFAFASREPAVRLVVSVARQRATWAKSSLKALFAINRDLFLRTALLTTALLLITRSGAQQGPVVLAANGILFQLFMLSTLILDGFESAAQVLCGEAIGAGDRTRFTSALRATVISCTGLAIVLSAIGFVAGDTLSSIFSTDPEVVKTAARYAFWLGILPLAGFASFVLDGVFVGAGWTRSMLGTMLVAMGVYVTLLFTLGSLANDGLWLAFALFFVVRALGQIAVLPRLMHRDFGKGHINGGATPA